MGISSGARPSPPRILLAPKRYALACRCRCRASLLPARLSSIGAKWTFPMRGRVYRQIASYGFSREFEKFMEEHPIQIGRGTTVARAIQEKRPIQIPDVFADPEFTNQEAA